jgi:dienelactone hydrolase
VTDAALEAFHLFRRIPELVRGGTINAASFEDGRVRWTGTDGTDRVVDLETGEITEAIAKAATDGPPVPAGLLSDDGSLLATVSDGDVVVTVVATGEERTLAESTGWAPVRFVGTRLLVSRSEDDERPTYPLVNWLTSPVTVTPFPHMPEYAPAPVPSQLAFLDTTTGSRTLVDARGRCDLIPLGPSANGKYLLAMGWDKVRTVELVRIDVATGAVIALMSDSVANTVPYLYTCLMAGNREVPGFDGRLWASDRDGDLRLYAVPLDGSDPRPLTPPGVQLSQPVTHVAPMNVVVVDDAIVVMAHTDPSRPYDVHLCATDLQGDFRVLTTEPGIHSLAPVPGADVFLDRHSGHQRPPRTDLLRTDGTLVATLESADVTEVEAAGRVVPEEFVVKAADGVTDLHGLLWKPVDFDPNSSYPLVDVVYGGPQQVIQTHAYVSPYAGNSPWTDWSGLAAAFTRLGFVGIVLDGRGTPGRGRAFQEAAREDFPNLTAADHVAAIRQLAAERPWIDASRCGALGHSFGGYHAVRLGLYAPDVFKAVVSAAGAFEPALQDRTFAEGLLGASYQEDPELYADAGCAAHAKRFEPELLIVAGTHDTNVTLNHAMHFSEALTQAGKHHDLVLLQGKDHQLTGVHGDHSVDRAARFFRQHLSGG